jgi:D-alanine--D-alanine ligase
VIAKNKQKKSIIRIFSKKHLGMGKISGTLFTNMRQKKLKVALLCGGPSLERGISLNSARSVCDHLHSDEIEVSPIYFDHQKKPYQISRAQLYSNTPSDFDFKLQSASKPLSQATFHRKLKDSDIAFPVMHGAFGEDGEIQRLLEKHKIPYVGSGKQACQNCFDKYKANEHIKEKGFFTLPSTTIKIHEPKTHKSTIKDFFTKHKIKRAVVKPATGGSSIGVYSVETVEEAMKAARSIFSKRIDTRVVIEPFAKGIEFTVIILQNRFGQPVALFPAEIETDYSKNQFFDFRKKYLATRQVTYHCPPRFSQEITEKIQIQAEQLFMMLGMRDFARFDGWLLDDGNIWFSDFNPISGMEQNSFLFLQAAQIGFSHSDLLHFIVRNASAKYGIEFPERKEKKAKKKKRVNVIFGGSTAERQVSVMSGTNVWLKLRKSDKYDPHPYLLDMDDATVWRLPYSKTLNHTVEEISESCRAAKEGELRLAPLRRRVLEKIAARPGHLNEELFIPERMPLKDFIEKSEMIFIGLHGGMGENGDLQRILEREKVKFNGSDSKASHLCMDKYATGSTLQGMEKEGIHVPRKHLTTTVNLLQLKDKEILKLWRELKKSLQSFSIIVKPKGDGCSAGIVKLVDAAELKKYIGLICNGSTFIPPNTFKSQEGMIEMPTRMPEEFMFEQFIVTDKVKVVKNQLKWDSVSGWVEVTVGVLGSKGEMKAFSPSLTVSSGNILSLEEKFQGGTGVNITPPPHPYVKRNAVKKTKERVEKVAKALGISGYARIDAFMEVKTGEIMIIEANSTPGLTPSTVIFHQALAETPQMYPIDFLEKIIKNA